MKPLHMQHFMADTPFGEVSVGRRKELNALGVDNDCEFALSCSAAIVLLDGENYVDVNARPFLHFKDELLEWLTETGKILGLHLSMMFDIR